MNVRRLTRGVHSLIDITYDSTYENARFKTIYFRKQQTEIPITLKTKMGFHLKNNKI